MSKFYQNKSTLLDLLNEIKKKRDIQELFDCLKRNRSQLYNVLKGNLFEKIWDIVIKLGFHSKKEKLTHYYGNVNTWDLDKILNMYSYLNSTLIYSKNKGGKSDITYYDETNNKWVFMSSKFNAHISDTSIEDYDVEKLSFHIPEHVKKENYSIELLVSNKNDFEKLSNRIHSSNNKVKKTIGNIYDFHDLSMKYSELHSFLQNIEINQENIHNIFDSEKFILQPRFHQKLLVIKTMEQIKQDKKEILWGWKCRSGKTYGIGHLIDVYFHTFSACNTLIITPAPSETLSQFSMDLFKKYVNFHHFNIIEINGGNSLKKLELIGDKNIIIVSKQLLGMHLKELNKFNKELDLIIFDENHYGGTTNPSKEIINKFSSKNTVHIYLTATFHKPLNTWDIEDSCQFYWNIEDEQLCKKRNKEDLKLIHGNDIDLILNDDNTEYELEFYDKMPEMHLITPIIILEKLEEIKRSIQDTDFGFSMDCLFSLNKEQTQFNYVEELNRFLQLISDSKNKIIRNKNAIYERIKQLNCKYDSRFNHEFTTQLWFLPFGNGMKIDNVSNCLKNILEKDDIFKEYEILIINSKVKEIKNLKKHIQNTENEAKANKKKGLILLAGNQCSLGITLPLVDIVFLLNNIQSSDKIIQMMYRCMTETEDHSKKIGIVVDFNINRILNVITDYTQLKNKSIESNIKYIIENNLIKIDDDIFDNKLKSDEIVKKLIYIWKCNPKNIYKKLVNKLENIDLNIDKNDQEIINKKFGNFHYSNKNDVNKNVNENTDLIHSGKVILEDEYQDDSSEKSKTKSKKMEEEIKDIIFQKDILPYVVTMSSILCYDIDNNDFLSLLKYIENNHNLFVIFNKQIKSIWNKDDIFNIIKELCNKYIKNNSYINNIIIQIRNTMDSLIDNPEQLLEYIHSCLKPKEIQKKKNGEVFTMMNLVTQKLDKLENIYQKLYCKSIFSEKDFKWFDPANGMGNYPIGVYFRLMEGLKDEIPIYEERKKHIIENMLYMSEINELNNFETQLIFNSSKKYKLNLHCGNSLELNTQDVFGVSKFDVILGNPPFQETDAKSKSKGGTNLYTKFMNFGFSHVKENGFLMFINPISFIGPSTNKQMGNDILHNIFLKYDLHYWNMNECKKYFKGIGSTFTYYIIQKSISNEIKTDILSLYKKELVESSINMKKYISYQFLPIHITIKTLELVKKIVDTKNKIKIERCRKLDTSHDNIHLSLKKDDKFKYTTYHTKTKTYYSDIKLDLYDKYKILLNMSGHLNPELIKDGNITESKFYVMVNKIESKKILDILKSDDINEYLQLCKYSGFNSRPVLEKIGF